MSSTSSDGSYTLYLIGWKMVDDGGRAVINCNGRPDIEPGDIVCLELLAGRDGGEAD